MKFILFVMTVFMASITLAQSRFTANVSSKGFLTKNVAVGANEQQVADAVCRWQAGSDQYRATAWTHTMNTSKSTISYCPSVTKDCPYSPFTTYSLDYAGGNLTLQVPVIETISCESNTPPPPPAPSFSGTGLFTNQGGVFYSNGSRYCGFQSWPYYVALTGRNDLDGVPAYSGMNPANYDGACNFGVGGLFIFGGGVFMQTSGNQVCGFSSWESYVGRTGRNDVDGIAHVDGLPVSSQYLGACQ